MSGKPNNKVVIVQKPVSCLETVEKWKKEKIMKKQLENENMVRPFHAGSSSLKNASNKVIDSKSQQTSRIPSNSKLPRYIPRAAKCNNNDPAVKSIPEMGNKVKTSGVKARIQTGIPVPSTILAKGIQSRTGISVPSTIVGKEISAKGIQSRIKPIPSFAKKIPTQSKMPVLSGIKPIVGLRKRPGPVSKVDEKETLHSLIKGKKTSNEVTDKMKMASSVSKVKKTEEKKTEECTDESIPDKSVANMPQIFDCDVSIIKPVPSFAPADFKFVPPADLFDFSLDDAVLNRIKEFVSGTSVPSKPCDKLPVEDQDILSTPDSHEQSPVKNIDYLNQPSCNNGLVVCKEEYLDQPKFKIIQEEKNIDTDPCEIFKKPLIGEKLTHIQLTSDENLKTDRNEFPRCELPSLSEDISFSSPLNTVDLNKIKDTKKNIKLIKFKGEELQKGIASENKLSLSYFPQRPSMLKRMKRMSILNKENGFFTSHRSQRLSKLFSMDESPSCVSFITPRHSKFLHTKLSKKSQFEETFMSEDDSLFGDTSRPKLIPIKDLKTHEISHTNITADFENLTLEEFEKMKPEDLCDLDDTPEQKVKTKNISLLYSANKRKSMRRSIRGDLMSFSPIGHV